MMRITAAFPEPNHTQTPNKFFELLPEMSDSELRVTLIMIRNTFGWHRDEFKMGITKLADAAGLSRQGALDGARAAEERGTFKRSNPNEQGEAEWELVLLPLNPVEGYSPGPLYPVEGSPLASRGQVAVKESIKKNKINGANAQGDQPLPIDWQIAAGQKIQLPGEQFDAQMKDAAYLIAQANNADLEPLAIAFMQSRRILPAMTKEDLRKWRKAFREMTAARPEPVQALHVTMAVRQLLEKHLTISGPQAVVKTAISIANPAPEDQGYNPQGLSVNA
jgi:hypothetical protein